MIDLAIATCTTLPEPDADQAPLLRALATAGVSAQMLAWDDPRARFDEARLTLIRSTWNYIHHYDAFLAWASTLGSRLVNPASVVRWNTHKRYLRELDRAGLPTVETVLVPRGSGADLGDLLRKKHWFRAVAKPAVGAGSFQARVVAAGNEHAQWFEEALAARDMLVQPYMPAVETSGERAIVVIEGEPSHAVRKNPRFAADQERVTAVPIADDERALAKRAMSYATRELPSGALLYGRVDLVRDDAGTPRIMELELTEPSLFFAEGPATALDRFVAGIVTRLGQVPRRRAP